MATKALGRGTVNLSINVRCAVHGALGRAAFRLDVSMGEFCRRLFVAGARFVDFVQTAREAQQADQRALASLRSAQLPNSRGGVMITPEEAAEIEHEIAASARADGQLAECRLEAVAS
jgi:hypothetical protein